MIFKVSPICRIYAILYAGKALAVDKIDLGAKVPKDVNTSNAVVDLAVDKINLEWKYDANA